MRLRRKRKLEPARERRPDVVHDVGWGGPDCAPLPPSPHLVEGMLWTCECSRIFRFNGTDWEPWG